MHPGDPQQQQRIMRASTLFIAIIIVGLFAVLARVASLKLDPPARLAAAAGSTNSYGPALARRGDLLDRQGRIIATSRVGYRLFVDPERVDDLRTIAVELAQLIGGDPVEYDKAIIAREESRFVVINHLLDDGQLDAVRQASLPGVGLEPRLVRDYVNESVGSLIIGRVGFEHSGQGGMEQRFERRLERADGRYRYQRDAAGNPLWLESAGYEQESDGDDVRLSIDLVVQEIAERVLRQAVEHCNAGGGRMVVLDTNTGEVLALCDILHDRADLPAITVDKDRAVHPSLGRNRCATDLYEPGSTFKPFIWSRITEMGIYQLEDILATPADGAGPYRTSRGRSIRDAHYYGPSTWEFVLVKSMNSGMAIAAEKLTERQMQDNLRRFGFGERTGSGLPGESIGMMTDAKKWNHYTQTSVAMGHEIGVTPLQMVQGFAAFARDGTLPDIRLTAVDDSQQRVSIVRRAVTSDIAYRTRCVMRKVMTDGTGRKSQSELYQLFGKSGTAQLPKAEGGGYYEYRYVSSFIAGAPLEQPRLVVLCVIDDPDRRIAHYGGEVAGPAVRDVMDEALQYLGVASDMPGETMSHQPEMARIATSLRDTDAED